MTMLSLDLDLLNAFFLPARANTKRESRGNMEWLAYGHAFFQALRL